MMQSAVSDSLALAARPPRLDDGVFRPVQYLGSKLRVVEEIAHIAGLVAKPGSRIVDPFTGSSVVSQALAASGYQVTAIDTQAYAVVMARACLGVGRQEGERFHADEVLAACTPQTFDGTEAWAEYATIEADLISSDDAFALRDLYYQLPLIWKDRAHPLYVKVAEDTKISAIGQTPLITSNYSGNYFGVRQALEIDQIRHAIEKMRLNGGLSGWQQAAALTALFSAASRAVHSAGKHFAQPMSASGRDPSSFNNARLMQDRSISIKECFLQASAKINDIKNETRKGQNAFQGEAENLSSSFFKEADLVYLDPPYTAQQYSRFYHVLETIHDYTYPKLVEEGKVTRGIYPAQRYKSSFCSKAKASNAMLRLLSSIHAGDASALISYSRSEPGSNGNSRMIDFDRLLDCCNEVFGVRNVDCIEMSHGYRQFNSSARAKENRKDPEILILCKTG